jgi:hypothetical protein
MVLDDRGVGGGGAGRGQSDDAEEAGLAEQVAERAVEDVAVGGHPLPVAQRDAQRQNLADVGRRTPVHPGAGADLQAGVGRAGEHVSEDRRHQRSAAGGLRAGADLDVVAHGGAGRRGRQRRAADVGSVPGRAGGAADADLREGLLVLDVGACVGLGGRRLVRVGAGCLAAGALQGHPVGGGVGGALQLLLLQVQQADVDDDGAHAEQHAAAEQHGEDGGDRAVLRFAVPLPAGPPGPKPSKQVRHAQNASGLRGMGRTLSSGAAPGCR